MGFFKKLFGKKEQPKKSAEKPNNSAQEYIDSLSFFADATNAVWESRDLRNVVADIVFKLREKSRGSIYYGKPVNGWPHIPELFIENPNIVGELSKTLAACGINEPDWMAAGAFYAGHTAVTIWHRDWDKMKRVGVAKMMTHPLVLNRVVEFTSDLRNTGSERHAMSVELQKLSLWALGMAKKQYSNVPEDQAEILSIVTAMLAMSFFGMQLKMAELGLR